jgi:hypothetical protein
MEPSPGGRAKVPCPRRPNLTGWAGCRDIGPIRCVSFHYSVARRKATLALCGASQVGSPIEVDRYCRRAEMSVSGLHEVRWTGCFPCNPRAPPSWIRRDEQRAESRSIRFPPHDTYRPTPHNTPASARPLYATALQTTHFRACREQSGFQRSRGLPAIVIRGRRNMRTLLIPQ